MQVLKSGHDHYLAEFESFAAHLASHGEPAWLLGARRDAMAYFEEFGFPTTRLEEWKYTSVSAIARTPFRLAEKAALTARELAGAGIGLWDGPQAVFVNGFFAPELSTVAGLPAGVEVGPLSQAIRQQPELLRRELERDVAEKHAFTALGLAFFVDGAFVHLGRKAIADRPIHLVFVSVATGVPTFRAVRNVVLAEELAQGTVIESYVTVGPGNPGVLGMAVTQATLADGAFVDHYRVQREGPGALHVSSHQARLGRSARLETHTFTLGGGLVRNDVAAVLDGEGAECRLDGLYLASDDERVDNRTILDHARPRCSSHERYKGIVDGKAQGTFNGLIIVRPGAAGSDAHQTNQNLQLSREATINARPQLEIYHDDVKCSHGATIGQLDEDALFYLRSRGLGLREARALLTYAFAAELVERARVPAVRATVSEFLLQRLGGDRPDWIRPDGDPGGEALLGATRLDEQTGARMRPDCPRLNGGSGMGAGRKEVEA